MKKKKKTQEELDIFYDETDDRSMLEREESCISLAMALAEKKLRDGTASSQMICQFLKAGSARERLEQENKELENQLLEAKTDNIRSMQHSEELYANALAAFTEYVGL